jgi:FixJ family two-component response regulator
MPSPRVIAIVEDDSSLNLAISRLLGAYGWKTYSFPSAEAFLESEAGREVSGFVFDIQLPGIDGFALYERLVAAGRKAPVIFMTAFDRAGDHEQAERAGAIEFFTKPFSGHRLIDALNRSGVEN